MTGPPCMPNEVHPAYVDKPQIIDWLNGEGRHDPRVPPIGWRLDDEPVEMPQHVLTRHEAWGLAPYVGDPFVYVWRYAEDELGRTVGGEARIQRLPPKPWGRWT